MIRVVVPAHLKTLIGQHGEVSLEVAEPVTQSSVIDAVEERYPQLRGTIRDPQTKLRRTVIRFFACEEDPSHESPDAELSAAVIEGKEPFFVIGAMAGG